MNQTRRLMINELDYKANDKKNLTRILMTIELDYNTNGQ